MCNALIGLVVLIFFADVKTFSHLIIYTAVFRCVYSSPCSDGGGCGRFYIFLACAFILLAGCSFCCVLLCSIKNFSTK